VLDDHRELQAIAQGQLQGDIIERAAADVVDVRLERLAEGLDVVAEDAGARGEVGFEQLEDRQARVLPPVEEEQVNGLAHEPQGLQGVALEQLDFRIDAGAPPVFAGAFDLAGLDFGGDDAPAAVVADGGGEVDGGNAELGAELDDVPGAAGAGKLVEGASLGWIDGDEGVLQVRLGGLHGGAPAKSAADDGG